MENQKEFVIDRTKWLRGKESKNVKGGSYLLREKDLKMCCLGFYAKSCGVKDESLLQRGTPSTLRAALKYYGVELIPEEMNWLYEVQFGGHYADAQISNNLMRTNDNTSNNITEEDREKEITDLFASRGIAVRFIN